MSDAIITGAISGLLYGLLGFAIVLLYKMTGIANFAAGSLATLGAVAVYELTRHGVGLAVAIVAALVLLSAVGAVVYLVVMRPHDTAGPLNLTVRTLGLYLLAGAAIDKGLGQGQPFTAPQVFPARQAALGPLHVPVAGLGILAVAALLAAVFAAWFRFSRTGLLLRAVASDRATARLLGARVRRLEVMSWAVTTALAAGVGILTAPSHLLSAQMMDDQLLFVFAAVVIGGLTSLSGAFAGGVAVGLVQGLVYYASGSADLALLAVFGLFLSTLLVRPHGLWGEAVSERL